MTIAGFRAQNHPSQVAARGARDHIDDRATPPDLFDALNARFQFSIDVAASTHNAKCCDFFTIEDNGLAQPWRGRVWCNPPFSNIPGWLAKAWAEWKDGTPDLIVMLLPANRTEMRWWQDLVEPYRDGKGPSLRVEFLSNRTRFVATGDFVDMFGRPRGVRPPFGCCLLIWS